MGKPRKYRGELTERQFYILSWIVAYIEQRGFPPTLREIGSAFGISSSNGAADHLRFLENKGYITRHKWGEGRGFRVNRLPDGRPVKLRFVPDHDMKPTDFFRLIFGAEAEKKGEK